MKHFPLTTTVMSALVGALSLVSAISAEPPPRLHAQGNKLVDPQGKEVILRGVSIPYLSQKRDRTVEERISMAHALGARVVRLPLYDRHRSLDPLGANEAYIRSAVQQATSLGMYAIIDFHAGDDLKQRVPNAHYFWHEIAPLYKDQPNVIFELYNEDSYFPNKKGRPWPEFKKLITPVVKVAREKAPETLLLVSAPAWSHQLEGIVEDPIDDSNVAYVSHLYPSHGKEFWQQAIDVKQHYPVFITEFGWQNAGAQVNFTHRSTTRKWGNAFQEFLNANGFSWTAFCFDNEHAPVMFDKDWNLLGGDDYCGEAIVSWLREAMEKTPK